MESKYLQFSSSSKHFNYFYSASLDENTLSDIIKTLEDNYDKQCSFLEIEGSPTLSVYIYPNRKEFHEECCEKDMVSWMVTSGKNLRISTIDPMQGRPTTTYDELLNEGLTYAMALALTSKDEISNHPKWLLGGIAGYLSKSGDKHNKKIAYAMRSNSCPTISKLTEVSDEEFGANKGYSFAPTIIEFIINEYGKDKLLEIVKNTQKGVFNILSTTQEKFEEKWYEYLKDAYLYISFEKPSFLNLEQTSTHFIISYNDSLAKKTLEDVTEKLEKEYPRLIKFFDVKEDLNIPVHIYPDRKSFHVDHFGEEMHGWLVGCCSSGTLLIVDPNNALPEHSYSDMLDVAVHELVHLLTYLNSDYDRPGWVSEGIAKFLANPSSKEEIQSCLSNLDSFVDHIFGNDYQAFQYNYGYTFSHTIIEHILKEFSEEKLKEILKDPHRSPFEILGIEKDVFISGWKEYVLNSYK